MSTLLDEQGIRDLVDEVQYHEKQTRIVARQGQEVKADLSQLKGCSDSLVSAFTAYVQLLELASSNEQNTHELRSARQRKDDAQLAYERVATSVARREFDFASYLRGDDDPLGPPSPSRGGGGGSQYEVNFLKDQMEIMRKTSDELRNEVAALKLSLADAERNARDAESRAAAVSVKADDDRRIQSLERQLAALEAGRGAGPDPTVLQSDLDKARAVVSQLTQENKIVEGKLATLQQESSQLKDRYNLLEQELQRRSQPVHGVYGAPSPYTGVGNVQFGHGDGQLMPNTTLTPQSTRPQDSQQVSVLVQRNRVLERSLAEKDVRIRMLEEDKVRLSDRAAGQPGAMSPSAIQELKEIRSMYEEMQSVSRATITDLETDKARLVREKAELEAQLSAARQQASRHRVGDSGHESTLMPDQDAEALRQDLLESQNDVEKIRRELTNWKLEREDMAAQLDQYYVKLAQADKEIQVYRSRVAEQESYIELMTNTQRAGLDEQALSVRMEAVVSSLRTRLRELEQELLERDADAIKAQHTHTRLQTLLVDKEEEITRLRAKVSELEQGGNRSSNRILGANSGAAIDTGTGGDKTAGQQLEALRRTIGTQETHIRMLTDQLAEARERVQQLTSDGSNTDALRTSGKENERRVQELETQLRKVTDEHTEAQYKVARLSQENSTLHARVEGLETGMKQLGEDRNSGMTRLTEQEKALQEARGQGAALQRECDKRGDHIVSLESLVNNLKNEIAQLQQQQQLAGDREKELLGRQEKMAEQAEAYCKEVYTELASTKRQQQQEVEMMNGEKMRLKQQLDDVTAKLEVAQREQNRLDNAVRDEGQRATQEVHQLQLQLQDKTSQLQACQNELAQLRPEKASLQTQLHDVQSRAEQAAFQHREALSKSELTNSATIASLRKELELVQSSNIELKRARDNAIEDLTKFRTDAEDTNKTQSAQARQQISALEQQLYAMVAELDKANALLVQGNQRESMLEAELDQFRNQGVRQLQDAQQQLQQFKQELNNRSARYNEVNRGLDDVQAAAGDMYNMLSAIWKRLQGGQSETVGVQVEMFEGTRTGGEVHQMRTPELRGTLLDNQLHLRQITQEHEQVQQRAKESERAMQRAREQMQELGAALEGARQQVGDITVQRNSAELEVSRLRREVDRLRSSQATTRSPNPHGSPHTSQLTQFPYRGDTTSASGLNLSGLGFPSATSGANTGAFGSSSGYVPRKYH